MWAVYIWKPQRPRSAQEDLRENKTDHSNQPTEIHTSPNTTPSYVTLISTALLTSETSWSLQVWHLLRHNKHVISRGMFSKAERQRALSRNSQPSAYLVRAKTTSAAKTDDVAADRAQSTIVPPAGCRELCAKTHTNKANTGKVRGIYSPPLMLQSDLWVPLI